MRPALAALLVENGNPEVRADAAVAAVLAEGGTRAAAKLVAVNLAASDDDDRVRQARHSSNAPPRRLNALWRQRSRVRSMSQDIRPAWSLPAGKPADRIVLPVEWPVQVTREWAWGESTGKGVSVCILDSGVDAGHELVGEVSKAVAVSLDADGQPVIEEDTEGDLCGHGTACAGVVRSLAPGVRHRQRSRARRGFTGSGDILLGGLKWAVEQGFDVINMSLSTTKRQFAGILHELTDAAYFRRTVLVASAQHARRDYPWKFSSVISVASHEESDPFTFFYNPDPPVEFFARGVDVEVAWVGGSKIRCTGNSFATPHMSGVCALILSKHPELTPFQLKSVLHLTSTNVAGGG